MDFNSTYSKAFNRSDVTERKPTFVLVILILSKFIGFIRYTNRVTILIITWIKLKNN